MFELVSFCWKYAIEDTASLIRFLFDILEKQKLGQIQFCSDWVNEIEVKYCYKWHIEEARNW